MFYFSYYDVNKSNPVNVILLISFYFAPAKAVKKILVGTITQEQTEKGLHI